MLCARVTLRCGAPRLDPYQMSPARAAYLAGTMPADPEGPAMRAAITMLALAVAAFAAALALRWAFLWDVVAVPWEEHAQPVWRLEVAFLLRTIENVAAIVGVIVLGFMVALSVRRRQRSPD
jgi:hypothetical protein